MTKWKRTVLKHAMIGPDNLLNSLPLGNVDVAVTFINDIITQMSLLLPLVNCDIRGLHVTHESGSSYILSRRESLHFPSLRNELLELDLAPPLPFHFEAHE
jgi:hypothetical protein